MSYRIRPDEFDKATQSMAAVAAQWDRRLRRIKAIAEALQAAPEEILGMTTPKKRGAGPTGKARQVFERVSQLPRATQQRILANVEDALTAYEVRKAG